MATRESIAIIMSAYSTSIAPTMVTVQRSFDEKAERRKADPKRAEVEELLLVEAQQEEELETAQRNVFGQRWPLECMRLLVSHNTKLLLGARGAIDKQREWEASSIIQHRVKNLLRRKSKARAELGKTDFRGRMRWNQLSDVVTNLPLERKKKAKREALVRALEWCEEHRGKLQEEARALYRASTAQA
eukprot:6445682-Prymnesium_polylepis.1